MVYGDKTGVRVGVLGGGQLGRMLVQAGRRLGLEVSVLDGAGCPAGGIASKHVVGSFKDKDTVLKFVQQGKFDVLTVEIEHVNVDALAAAEDVVSVQPTADTIRVVQDKLRQKDFVSAAGVPVGPYREVPDFSEAGVKQVALEFGYPLMLKARRQAYDGRGNHVVRSPSDIPGALKKLGPAAERGGIYAEKWVPFVRELAVMVARSLIGTVRTYPVVQTAHRDNICHTVVAPALVSQETANAATEAAKRAVECMTASAGVFGVELFELEDGTILYNEMAPRPHNSGHYTIEGCETSQYEQHLRAVLGMPLGSTDLQVGAAVMINILGVGTSMVDTMAPMVRALGVAGATPHWYEKLEVKPQRKMGHITVVGPTIAEALDRARLVGGATSLPAPPSAANERVTARVGVIMGSDSDLPVMKAAGEILEEFGVPYELTIVSAHRTPIRMIEYAQTAHMRGLQVIIAGAGGAAHLPGMVAAVTPLPVVGVPVKGSSLEGQDSLLSIVQMPRGVPVATVAINNATNAALLAIRIMGASDPRLLGLMAQYQAKMEGQVMEKVEVLNTVGWRDYKKPEGK